MSAAGRDALERLAGVGDDLFRRVEGLLGERGGPGDSPLWELVRRVGGLPSDALEFALRIDVAGLRRAADELRAVGRRFAGLPGRLRADVGRSAWEGGGAEAFGVVWEALAEHIGDGSDNGTIAGRMLATAEYLDGVAAWGESLRYEMAEAVARVVGSAEAVAVVTARDSAAAVRIAVRVLRTVADACDAAEELEGRFMGRLGELEYRPPRVPIGPAVISGVTRVNL